MKPSIKIRTYRSGDFDRTFQLLMDADLHDRSERQLTSETLSESLDRPNYTPAKDLFLAESEAEIVGFCNVTPERRIKRALLDVLVHPKLRRKGIATALLRHAVERARECGATVAQAEIPATNPAARGLFSSLDFRSVRLFYEMAMDLSGFQTSAIEHPFSSRPLQNSEEEKLTGIQNRTFTGTWGFNPNTEEEIIYRLNQSGRSRDDVTLLYNDNEVIGYCWVTIDPVKKQDQRPVRGRIHMMGVDPGYRGRGLGKAVLIAGLSNLKRKGIKVAELTVDGENKPACTLYKSMGFEVRLSSVWYEKRLI